MTSLYKTVQLTYYFCTWGLVCVILSLPKSCLRITRCRICNNFLNSSFLPGNSVINSFPTRSFRASLKVCRHYGGGTGQTHECCHDPIQKDVMSHFPSCWAIAEAFSCVMNYIVLKYWCRVEMSKWYLLCSCALQVSLVSSFLVRVCFVISLSFCVATAHGYGG